MREEADAAEQVTAKLEKELEEYRSKFDKYTEEARTRVPKLENI